jgi:hypothetical protein
LKNLYICCPPAIGAVSGLRRLEMVDRKHFQAVDCQGKGPSDEETVSRTDYWLRRRSLTLASTNGM